MFVNLASGFCKYPENQPEQDANNVPTDFCEFPSEVVWEGPVVYTIYTIHKRG